MESVYEIVEQSLDSAHSALVLREAGHHDTFLDEMATDHRRKDEAKALKRSLIRIADYGLSWALASETVKLLKTGAPGLLVAEVRVHRRVHRIMAYAHDREDGPLVLLFPFKGHTQRSSGGIPEQTLAKGIKLAKIAKRLLENEQ